MRDSFTGALALQRLPTHTAFLKRFGFSFLTTTADDGRKLHDIYDWADEAWFECKNDRSAYTFRLLVEYKANVPESLLVGIPLRRPLRASRYIDRLTALPSRYDALACDVANLERRHFLSYHFERTGETALYSLRELRRVVADHERHEREFLVVGHEAEHWRTVAVAVPLTLVKPLTPREVWTG